MKIKNVFARQILDSRGFPTVEVDVTLESGIVATASVPSGASTGENEAVEIRDGGKKFCGKGVLKVIKNINDKIATKLVGESVFKQEKIDKIMIDLDGKCNKSKLGANAILGCSLAVARAAAKQNNMHLFEYLGKKKGKKLPVVMMNILNGGKHAGNNINCQEYMILPISAKTFADSVRMNVEVFHSLKQLLKNKKLSTAVGDEGGFAPNLKNDEEGLKIIVEAICNAGYKPAKDIAIALDVAASEMWKEADKKKKSGKYYFWKTGEFYSTEKLISYYEKLIEKYPIVSIEDGLAENDWQGWQKITDRLGDKVNLVGDDLFVTNSSLLQKGIEEKVANSILIKPNQIGTVSETILTIKMAQKNGYEVVISHRSGETLDTFIADLAVAFNCDKIKSGAPSRGERVAKYNRLLKIDEVLGKKAIY